jgi:hypothetical protein
VILRAVAALTLVLGIVALLGFQHAFGSGPTSAETVRHLRAMKDRTTQPTSVRPVAFAAFDSLPHGWSVAEYSALEARAVSLDGYVQRMTHSADGDIHLEIVPTEVAPGESLRAYVTAEVTAPWRRGSGAWSWESLAATFRPVRGGEAPYDRPTRRVRVSGWLLYDFQYDGIPSESARLYSNPRLTGWEIHPVTRIEAWDERTAAFVEVTR